MSSPLHREFRLTCLAVFLFWLVACGNSPQARSHPGADAHASDSPRPATAAQSAALPSREDYRQSMKRAQTWLDTLRVDPADLRAHGIKGKKKLVELMDAYYSLWKVAPPEDRAPLLARIRDVVKVTYEPAYHDMLSTSDELFKEDATSYLRAAVLMDRLGLDTRLYRAEILKIQDRL